MLAFLSTWCKAELSGARLAQSSSFVREVFAPYCQWCRMRNTKPPSFQTRNASSHLSGWQQSMTCRQQCSCVGSIDSLTNSKGLHPSLAGHRRQSMQSSSLFCLVAYNLLALLSLFKLVSALSCMFLYNFSALPSSPCQQVPRKSHVWKGNCQNQIVWKT